MLVVVVMVLLSAIKMELVLVVIMALVLVLALVRSRHNDARRVSARSAIIAEHTPGYLRKLFRCNRPQSNLVPDISHRSTNTNILGLSVMWKSRNLG